MGPHSTQVSNDGKFIYDRFTDTTTPDHRLIINTKGEEIKTIKEITLENYEPYRVHTPKLLKIHKENRDYYARLYFPKDFNPSNQYPLIVNIYGGPGVQVVTNRFSVGFEQVLVENGFFVFSLDNRGSLHRGHAWETPIHKTHGRNRNPRPNSWSGIFIRVPLCRYNKRGHMGMELWRLHEHLRSTQST
jgi:dipeptidyl-peptidase-4